jgi:DNA-binding NarL/FixJ family response regulator
LDASELVSRLHQTAPAVKIIGLLSQCNEYLLHTLVAVECHGLLFDVEENLGSLADAIKQVRHGVRFVSIRIRQGQAALHTAPTAFPKLLSRREQEVLVCVAHSMPNDEIAVQLGLSAGTVAFHRKSIMSKLNLHNTPQLIRYCIEKGFNSAFLPRPNESGSAP